MADGRLEVLNEDSNFREWQSKTMKLLQLKGVEDVITSACDVLDSRKNEKAALLIINNISPEYVTNIHSCKTAKEMMLKLEARFSQKTIFSKLGVRKQLLNLKCDRSESMRDHFVKFDILISNLEELGCTLDETDKIYHLLFTLLERHQVLISSLDNALWDNMTTLDCIKSILLDYELSEMCLDTKFVLEECGDLTQSDEKEFTLCDDTDIGQLQSNYDKCNHLINDGQLVVTRLDSEENYCGVLDKSVEQNMVTITSENMIEKSNILENKSLEGQIQNAENTENSEKTSSKNRNKQRRSKNKIILGNKSPTKTNENAQSSTEKTQNKHTAIQDGKPTKILQNDNNYKIKNSSKLSNPKIIDRCENVGALGKSFKQLNNHRPEIPHLSVTDSQSDSENSENPENLNNLEKSTTDLDNPCLIIESEQELLKVHNCKVLLRDVADYLHCTKCNKWFSNIESINQHKKTHEISQKTPASLTLTNTDHSKIMRTKKLTGTKSSKTYNHDNTINIGQTIEKVLSINTGRENAPDIPVSPPKTQKAMSPMKSLSTFDSSHIYDLPIQAASKDVEKASSAESPRESDEYLSDDEMEPLFFDDDCDVNAQNSTMPDMNNSKDEIKEVKELNLHDSMIDIHDNQVHEQDSPEKLESHFKNAIIVDPNKTNVMNELDSELIFEGSEIVCETTFLCELKLRDVSDELLCSFCDKWFSTARDLKLHKKSHTEQTILASK